DEVERRLADAGLAFAGEQVRIDVRVDLVGGADDAVEQREGVAGAQAQVGACLPAHAEAEFGDNLPVAAVEVAAVGAEGEDAARLHQGIGAGHGRRLIAGDEDRAADLADRQLGEHIDLEVVPAQELPAEAHVQAAELIVRVEMVVAQDLRAGNEGAT